MTPEPSLEQEDLQRRMLHYFRANPGMTVSKRSLMRALDLEYDLPSFADHVRFHWAVLRLNDMLRSHNHIIASVGTSYEFREI